MKKNYRKRVQISENNVKIEIKHQDCVSRGSLTVIEKTGKEGPTERKTQPKERTPEMASSIIELYVDVPADRQANIFGQFDEHLKLIERTLNVTMIFRDGSLKILGSQEGATQAKAIVEELNTLAGRGNTITQQNVNYALSLAMEKIGSVMEEIDKDFICNTIQGRPIKPKTLGQKDYVEQIRKKMIVFGVGPAGTGKTYLAMAMAVTAFRNEEVSRIILTRPAIEAGEKLGFLPGDLQSKVDPYLRPLYDALYQIMGADSFAKNMEKRSDRGCSSCLYARSYSG